ncbi:MAG: phage major capsid protein [Alphaproteobacteria bacterium]|nr:phage major capsid protein [Alphaproteobacteria bacterium]MBR3661761.1 phage major capsid protein [Alphaproteobacteria bacterium]
MMANQDYNDVFTVTLENRSKSLADNVSKNNALLSRLKSKGNLRPISGGSKILEELEYGEGDMVWYSGYDTISYTPKQLFSAAEYALKLCAVPVAVSGEELLINSGDEQVMDLLEKRIANAEKTMCNKMSAALFGDGTASSGKAIGGLALLVADDPTSGTVGGINRATTGNEFWRNKSLSAALTADNIRTNMDKLYLNCSRGTDKPDLIVCDDEMYSLYEKSVSDLQRFTNPNMADAGFVSLKYKGADVIFDGGQGGNCPAKHMYFLNTDFIYLRSHKDRNMKVIGGERMAVNQDALYKIIGWAGNMTMSNAATQGVLIDTTGTSDSSSEE